MLEKRTPIPVDEAVRRVSRFQKRGKQNGWRLKTAFTDF